MKVTLLLFDPPSPLIQGAHMLKMGWATLFPLTKNHDWIGGGGGGVRNTENKRKDIVDTHFPALTSAVYIKFSWGV